MTTTKTTIGFGRDDIIAAIRDVQAIVRDMEHYSADGRYILHIITEDLIKGLHESNSRFWFVYRMWSADNPDHTDEIMDRVFALLDIDSIDTIALVLS